jgi:hypothetical protein
MNQDILNYVKNNMITKKIETYNVLTFENNEFKIIKYDKIINSIPDIYINEYAENIVTIYNELTNKREVLFALEDNIFIEIFIKNLIHFFKEYNIVELPRKYKREFKIYTESRFCYK